jgi:plastocyanin
MKLWIACFLLSTLSWAAPTVPTREISVIVTKEGYYPKSLTVFQGEKVKFYVTSTVEEPDCMLVQGHKVFLAANKGKISEAEAVFETAGEFSFYCPSSKHDGKITVIKKSEPRPVRGLAGQNDPAVWTPKEYE